MSFMFDTKVDVEHFNGTEPAILAAWRDSATGDADVRLDEANLIKAVVDALGRMHWAIDRHAKTLHVTVSGHVNPDNRKREGWANDYIHLSVSVAEYRDPSDEDYDYE